MSSSVPNFGDAERKMAGKRKASVWFSALRMSASVGMFVEAEMSAMASTTATVGNEGTGTEGTGTEGGREKSETSITLNKVAGRLTPRCWLR